MRSMLGAKKKLQPLLLVTASTLLSAGCGKAPLLRKSFVECNSTDTCQAQIRERDHAYAKAIANEPISKRIDVATVTRVAVVDRQRQRVHVLDPHFVTLDLATGKEIQRFDNVSGDNLWRAGMLLVTAMDASKEVSLTFVDPAKPNEAPVTCSPKVPKPPEADHVDVFPFDRAGKIYFYWQSGYSYRGGTPPGVDQLRRRDQAEGCGIMQIDATTCSAQSVSMDNFIWEPPEGRRQRPGEKNFCAYLSVLRDIPAAAASVAPSDAGYGQLAPATRAPTLTVKSEITHQDSCRQETSLTLEARNESAALLWSHPLAPIGTMCGPP
jgi:hypothetical protein